MAELVDALVSNTSEKSCRFDSGSGYFNNKASDFQGLYCLPDRNPIDCKNLTQAIKIRQHIKRMKSRVYINHLKEYPEITRRLLVKYA